MMKAPIAWKREDLVADERGRPCPAVVRYGPYLFISGADGHRRLEDECIDANLADDAVAQCRNAYGRIVRRLELAGYDGSCVVRVDNYTSGQSWRLQRMGLWPEFFGEENHQRVVSFGAQSRLHAINMLSAVAMAMDPTLPRTVAVEPPGRGRASRITRVGDLVFVIGVRGHHNVYTGEIAPEETDRSFEIQFENCLLALQQHLEKDGTPIENIARLDGAVRAARFVPDFEACVRRRFGGQLPFAGHVTGLPLGARTELEVGCIAVVPGSERTTVWSLADQTVADAVIGGGLVFLRSVSGLRAERLGGQVLPLHGDLRAQVKQAIDNIEYLLERAGSDVARLLRMDIFLRDIYAEDEVVRELARVLGKHISAVSFIGAEPQGGAELEVTAVAGAI